MDAEIRCDKGCAATLLMVCPGGGLSPASVTHCSNTDRTFWWQFPPPVPEIAVTWVESALGASPELHGTRDWFDF